MYEFDVMRNKTIAETVAALEEDARALAGGQTFIPTLKQRLAMPLMLVSLTGIGEMVGVCLSDAGEVCIGGATPFAAIPGWPRWPAISGTLRWAIAGRSGGLDEQ